jgi:hypothetical protein
MNDLSEKLNNFIKALADKKQLEAIKPLLTYEFKLQIISEIYWTYIIWDKKPSRLLQKIYDGWKNILKTCMLCSERENIKKCPMIKSEFAYVCKKHCDGSRKWTAPFKNDILHLSRKYCIMRRPNDNDEITCKNPIWRMREDVS